MAALNQPRIVHLSPTTSQDISTGTAALSIGDALGVIISTSDGQKEGKSCRAEYSIAMHKRGWRSWMDMIQWVKPDSFADGVRAKVRGLLKESLNDVEGSIHHVSNIRIDEIDANSAHTRAMVITTTPESGPIIANHGIYYDRWRKTPEDWRIEYRRYVQA